MDISCLEHVIGISQDDCICYDDGREDQFGISLSGYFMDNADYGLPLSFPSAVTDHCGDNNLWELSERMRREGINQFVTDLQRMIVSSRSVYKYRPWSGNIGNDQYDEVINVKPVHGVVIDTHRYHGVNMLINEIRYYAGPGHDGESLTIEIYSETELLSNDPPTPLITMTATVNKGGMAIFRPPTALHIDLIDSAGMSERIYIVTAEGTTVNDVKNTRMQVKQSGCCSRKKYSSVPLANEWLEAHGVQSDTLSGLFDADEMGKQSYGFMINATMTCAMSWLCQNMDWQNDPWGRVAAEAMLLYSMKALTAYILQSDMANIYTSARSEELLSKRDYIESMLPERMSFLAHNIPEGASDCYVCRKYMRKSTLLV